MTAKRSLKTPRPRKHRSDDAVVEGAPRLELHDDHREAVVDAVAELLVKVLELDERELGWDEDLEERRTPRDSGVR